MLNTGVKRHSSEIESPSRVRLSSVEIDGIEIGGICTKIELKESIHDLGLTGKLEIRDSVNFFEQTALESIIIRLARNEDEITLEFVLADIPLFAKSQGNSHVSAITLNLVQKWHETARITQISRYFKKPGHEILRDLIDGAQTIEMAQSPNSDQLELIIPRKPITHAIRDLLPLVNDDNGAPYYFYSTILGSLQLRSQAHMAQSEPYSEYEQSDADRGDMSKRILSVASDMGLSEVEKVILGATKSTNVVVDPIEKIYTETHISIDPANHQWISNTDPIHADRLPDGNIRDRHLNQSRLITPAVQQSIARADMYRGRLQTAITHDISLAGDFELNPGKLITLNLLKAIDPKTETENAQGDDNRWDQKLSGRYLITSVIHSIDSDGYYCNCRVKKDRI